MTLKKARYGTLFWEGPDYTYFSTGEEGVGGIVTTTVGKADPKFTNVFLDNLPGPKNNKKTDRPASEALEHVSWSLMGTQYDDKFKIVQAKFAGSDPTLVDDIESLIREMESDAGLKLHFPDGASFQDFIIYHELTLDKWLEDVRDEFANRS